MLRKSICVLGLMLSSAVFAAPDNTVRDLRPVAHYWCDIYQAMPDGMPVQSEASKSNVNRRAEQQGGVVTEYSDGFVIQYELKTDIDPFLVKAWDFKKTDAGEWVSKTEEGFPIKYNPNVPGKFFLFKRGPEGFFEKYIGMDNCLTKEEHDAYYEKYRILLIENDKQPRVVVPETGYRYVLWNKFEEQQKAYKRPVSIFDSPYSTPGKNQPFGQTKPKN